MKLRHLFLLFLGSASIGVSFAAVASYEGPMRFSVFRPCIGNARHCAPQILAEGTIERGSAQQFLKFLANRTRHEEPLPPQVTVAFDSPGGNLAAGIELGNIIRERKFDTYLSPSYERVNELHPMGDGEVFITNAKCASSCAFSFLGGNQRIIDEGARFGIHQFAGSAGNIGDAKTQAVIVGLAAYLEKMGVDRALLDIASLVPESSIHWLSVKQARNLRVDNTRPAVYPWRIRATAEGMALLYTEQKISSGRLMSVAFSVRNGRIIVHAVTRLFRSTFSDERLKNFPVNELPNLVFTADERELKTAPLSPWSKFELDDSVYFYASATLSMSDLATISVAKTIKVTDNFGHAIEDLSLSAALSTEELASGIALLKRTN